jgi:transposase
MADSPDEVPLATTSRVLLQAGLPFKKNLLASEAGREDVRQARAEWKTRRQPCMREATWVIDHLMNREIFDTYIETQLAPTLQHGDVVVLDNLSSHKSTKAQAILKQHGAWFPFLPLYSPDLNPIEMALAKLKAHLRRIGVRTINPLRVLHFSHHRKEIGRRLRELDREWDVDRLLETNA